MTRFYLWFFNEKHSTSKKLQFMWVVTNFFNYSILGAIHYLEAAKWRTWPRTFQLMEFFWLPLKKKLSKMVPERFPSKWKNKSEIFQHSICVKTKYVSANKFFFPLIWYNIFIIDNNSSRQECIDFWMSFHWRSLEITLCSLAIVTTDDPRKK